MTSADVVRSAGTELFVNRDPEAVDRYYAPNYRQHSPLAPDGPEALRRFVGHLPLDFRFEPLRILEDGDMVVIHCVYHGLGPTPMVAFNVFRVLGDRLAEHWEVLAPLAQDSVSGHSQVDGPTEVTDLDKTLANKALVGEFAQKVLMERDYAVVENYVARDFAQHNPEAGDGLEGIEAALAVWATQGRPLTHRMVHRIVGQGNFVLTVAEGEFGVPVALYDLWRLEDSLIVEHWDVIQPVPFEMPHGNGFF
ncbi:nuclear transport factor 2 family protein [Arthrobacter sp. USHLN218]|uniref:nuclear transport factor 2 family protein n=1 Tax=Arthrobacter sp. USHLN218 TaxID=3081232 RepID=UPI003015AE10